MIVFSFSGLEFGDEIVLVRLFVLGQVTSAYNVIHMLCITLMPINPKGSCSDSTLFWKWNVSKRIYTYVCRISSEIPRSPMKPVSVLSRAPARSARGLLNGANSDGASGFVHIESYGELTFVQRLEEQFIQRCR